MPSETVWGVVAALALSLLVIITGLQIRRTRARRISGLSVALLDDGKLVRKVHPRQPKYHVFRFIVADDGFTGPELIESSYGSRAESSYELRRAKSELVLRVPGATAVPLRAGVPWPISSRLSLIIQDDKPSDPQPGAMPDTSWAGPASEGSSGDPFGNPTWGPAVGSYPSGGPFGGPSPSDPNDEIDLWNPFGGPSRSGPTGGSDPWDNNFGEPFPLGPAPVGSSQGRSGDRTSSRGNSSVDNFSRETSSGPSPSRADPPNEDPPEASDAPANTNPNDKNCYTGPQDPSQNDGTANAEPGADPLNSTQIDKDVQFTAYSPFAIRRRTWYPLLVFAHKGTRYTDDTGQEIDPAEDVERQADSILGDAKRDYTQLRAFSAQPIPRGDTVRFVPYLAGAMFNPPELTFQWLEPQHRQEFRFSVLDSCTQAVLEGGVAIYRDLLLIAEIPLRIAVSDDAPVVDGPSVQTSAILYRKIFASYSHRDSDIVACVMELVRSTGDDYLSDVVTLRSGEIWSDRLMQMIDEADLFQLFWSSNSMHSPYVRNEWEYALRSAKRSFVRPVYWEDPQPEDKNLGLPPDALRQLHFAKLPLRTASSPASVRPQSPGHVEQVGNERLQAVVVHRAPSSLPQRTDDSRQAEQTSSLSPPAATPRSYQIFLTRLAMSLRQPAIILTAIILIVLSIAIILISHGR